MGGKGLGDVLGHILKGHRTSLSVQPRQVLARKGDPITHVFVPVSAILAAVVATGPGKSLDIALFGPGHIAGSAIAVGAQIHLYDIVARLGGEVVLAFLSDVLEPEVAAILLDAHREALGQYISTAGTVSGWTVDRRLAQWIFKVTAMRGVKSVVVSHQDIARSLDVRRPGVTTGLAMLEGKKLIRNARMSIQVLDAKGLIAYAERA